MRLLHALADLFYPPRCLACHQEPASPRDTFCDACRAALFDDASRTCPRCAMTVGPWGVINNSCPACRGQPLAFDGALRLGEYRERLAECVHRIKFASNEWFAETLGEHWAAARLPYLLALGPIVVIPIPLHWRKRLQRGYNPSDALAIGLCAKLGCECRPHWLKRPRPTEEQKTQLSLAARRKNVKDAFRATPHVAGRHVLLVDDVMTTGATASEAAAALAKAGASRVTVAILARAGG